MTIDVKAPLAPPPGRLTPRSSLAVANIELARHTLAELAEPSALEDAGERILNRLRRLVGDVAELNARS